jgi:sigma-70-like protein
MRSQRYRLISCVAATVAASLTLAGEAAGLPGLPTLEVPTLQPAPSLPVAPTPPSLPPAPSLPSVPVPSAPSTPSAPVPGVPTVQQPRQTTDTLGSVPGSEGGGSSPRVDPRSTRSGRRADYPERRPDGQSPASEARSGTPGTPTSRARRRRGARRGRQRSEAAPRFQRAVKKLQGCLYATSGLERRVLSLRAGLRGDPLSRRVVAERLGLSVGRVRRLERRGLRRLRAADRSDGCRSATSLALGEEEGAQMMVAAAQAGPRLAPVTALDRGSPAEAADSGKGRGEVLGAHRSSAPPRPPSRLAGATAEPPGNGNDGALIAAIAGGLLLLSALGLLTLRRFRHQYEAPSPPASVPPPPTSVPPPPWESPPPAPETSQGAQGSGPTVPRTPPPRSAEQAASAPPVPDDGPRATGGGRGSLLAASGLASLLLGRILQRRLRRRR